MTPTSSHHLLQNGPTGILLIHGFTANPNELLPLGRHLADQGLTVLLPTLPGHGTHAADLLNYSWRDWFEHVKSAYQELRGLCEEVFVGGLSAGALLALHLAAHREVRGLISLSAPVQFPVWKKIAVRQLRKIRRFRHKKNGEDVRDVAMRAHLGSYRRYPYYAVAQLFDLADHVRDDLPEIVQPLLVIHSKQDHTVPVENADIIMGVTASGEKKVVLLEESFHIITVDVEKDVVYREILNFIRVHSEVLPSPDRSVQRS